jgi:exodeoxyribonuclease-1
VQTQTFLWHDYETSGADPRRDRPLQFAAVRTDADLVEVGGPLLASCHPPRDRLPQPEACLITRIAPQQAESEGLREAEFARLVHDAMAEPGTCNAGYNSVRFDDEVTRGLLYRNFYEPYAREWQQGNSRWDLIDALRMAYALRPGGIEWPLRDDGNPSFRLEDLARVNLVREGAAHDALSDVRATLAMARLLRANQRAMFDYLFALRDKRKALALLDWQHVTPLVHSSSRIPAERGATTLIAPLAPHPHQGNAVVVFDLMEDPALLLSLDPDEIADRMFTPRRDLPDGEARIPLKLVRANHAPALAPVSVLKGVDCARIGLDPERCLAHADLIRQQAPMLRAKLQLVFSAAAERAADDADFALISGGLPPDQEASLRETVRKSPPDELAALTEHFREPRYRELLFRYRARNWPESLNADDYERWRQHCRDRLNRDQGDGSLTLPIYYDRITALRAERADDGAAQVLLDALESWGQSLEREFGAGAEPSVPLYPAA